MPSFISGLKEELRPAIKMLGPPTLNKAFKLALLQEQAVEAMEKRHKHKNTHLPKGQHNTCTKIVPYKNFQHKNNLPTIEYQPIQPLGQKQSSSGNTHKAGPSETNRKPFNPML